MNTYQFSRKYLDLRQFVFYLCLQWKKWILLSVLISAAIVLSGVYSQKKDLQTLKSKMTDGKIEKTLTLDMEQTALLQKYMYDREMTQKQQDYNANSLYMQINPDEKYSQILRYYIYMDDGTGAEEIITQMINELKTEDPYSYILSQTDLDCPAEYIREVVSFEAFGGNVIQLYVYAPDEKMMNVIGMTLQDYFENTIFADKKASIPMLGMELLQKYSTVDRDNALKEAQGNNITLQSNYAQAMTQDYDKLGKTELDYLKQYDKQVEKGENLTIGDPVTYSYAPDATFDKAKVKHDIKVFVPLSVLMGVILILISFMASSKIWSAQNIRDSFGIQVVSILPAEDKKAVCLSWGNQWIWKIYRRLTQPENAAMAYQGAYLVLMTGMHNKDYNLLIISNSLKKHEKAAELFMGHFIQKKGQTLHILSYEELLTNEEAVAWLLKADRIVTAEMIGQTGYKQLDKNLQLLGAYESKYAGHISVE